MTRCDTSAHGVGRTLASCCGTCTCCNWSHCWTQGSRWKVARRSSILRKKYYFIANQRLTIWGCFVVVKLCGSMPSITSVLKQWTAVVAKCIGNSRALKFDLRFRHIPKSHIYRRKAFSVWNSWVSWSFCCTKWTIERSDNLLSLPRTQGVLWVGR